MKGGKIINGRPGTSLEPLDFVALKEALIEKHSVEIRDEDVMSAALYPKVYVTKNQMHNYTLDICFSGFYYFGEKVPSC